MICYKKKNQGRYSDEGRTHVFLITYIRFEDHHFATCKQIWHALKTICQWEKYRIYAYVDTPTLSIFIQR